jgi:hypothetical protein
MRLMLSSGRYFEDMYATDALRSSDKTIVLPMPVKKTSSSCVLIDIVPLSKCMVATSRYVTSCGFE